MSFLTSLALFAAVLVGAPIAAHMLRRRRATEIELPTAKLLAATPPTARRRSSIEDRALLSLRAIAVLLLVLLGATPFVSCSRLSLLRKNGASVAMVLVIDDSLSMRIKLPDSNETRFERARRAARELLDDAAPGDAFAVVLAGSEARVALATTTDLAAARAAVDELTPSDRATDLEAALALSRDLLRNVPQPDRRVTVLSDLADTGTESGPLDVEADVSLWFPLPELTASPDVDDCAVVRAERESGSERVSASVACTRPRERPLKLGLFDATDAKKPLLEVELGAGETATVWKLEAGAPDALDVRLIDAKDAIASDDAAPVVVGNGHMAVGVISDAAATHIETGGPPAVEQALAALDLGSSIKSLAAPPEHAEELTSLAGLILDDVPGLTPEERRTTVDWVESGGHALIALGRRSSAAPLGAGFGQLVPGVARFTLGGPQAAKAESCAYLGEGAAGLGELHLAGRTLFDEEAQRGATVLCAFDDGSPLLLSRPLGRGQVILSAVSFSLDDGDLPLRPAFLALLDDFVTRAQSRGGSMRIDAGQAFTFPGATTVTGEVLALDGTPPTRLTALMGGSSPRVYAPLVGRYAFDVDAIKQQRVAGVPERELSLRVRALAPRAVDPALGGAARKLDASPYVAFALLGLMVFELLLRVLTKASATPAVAPQETPPTV